MNLAYLPFLGAAVLLILLCVRILLYSAGQRKQMARIKELEAAVRKSEMYIKNLQANISTTKEKEQELSTIFLFLPELISKLTSYKEKRDIFDIIIEWIQRLLNPRRSYIFQERDGNWISVVKRDSDYPMKEAVCPLHEGILGIAYELKMTIDTDDINLLSVEKQRGISRDPLLYLEIQVVSPIIYDNRIHGLIALSGIPKYSRQKKVLINMLSDITASSLTNSMLFSQFRHMASRDALTDLINKRGFESAMLEAIVKGSREKRVFSLFIFDIDYFKKYNDTNGHQAGDDALRITANLIKSNFRNGDVKARYGGEEFIVLMRDTRKEQAFRLAEMFREKVEQYPFPFEENQPQGRLTISGGVATFPADGTNIKELIEKADEALYMAKKSGRNQVIKARSFDFSDFSAKGENS